MKKKALLLAPVGFYFTTIPLMTAGGSTPTATCTPGNTVVTKVKDVGLIKVQCPPGLQMALRPQSKGVLTSPDVAGGNIERIGDICEGAMWAKLDDGGGFHVEIPQLPAETKIFYFPCVKGSIIDAGKEGHSCYIGIEVPGSNICAPEKGRMDLSIQEANGFVFFACVQGADLQPSDLKSAFDASCKVKVPLLEEATLTKEVGRYRMTVQKIPAQSSNICYICGGKDGGSKCEIHIAVSDLIKSGAVSESVTARTAAALGLMLGAVEFLRPY